MGGYGSGRRWADHDLIEHALGLEMSWFRARGILKPGILVEGESSWALRGEPCGSINWTLDLRAPDDPHMVFEYHVARNGARTPIREKLPLEATTPHYGGLRWWFVCRCGRQVGALYLPGGATWFRCRHCHGLVYQSQREIRRDRLLRRRDKLYRRLGGDPGEWLPKPKGMHQVTWERYQQELEWLEAEMNAQFFRDMRWTG